MNIALRNQHPRLASMIAIFRSKPLSCVNFAEFPQQRSTLPIPINGTLTDLRSCDVGFLFDYDIFPRRILSAIGEWQIEDRAMGVGDVIVQQIFLPPLPFSLKLIVAVQILQTIRSATEMSFAYGTIAGHVESGMSQFKLELQDGRLSAVIHTFSRPANLMGRLSRPVFARPYQQYCTGQALEHMRERFLQSNPE